MTVEDTEMADAEAGYLSDESDFYGLLTHFPLTQTVSSHHHHHQARKTPSENSTQE